jgi:hypothetical protein
MIRVLLDTNVVHEALLERDPWVVEANAIWAGHLQRRMVAHFTATSLTDVFYVSRRLVGRASAWVAVGTCLDQLYIIPVGLPVLQAAARMGDGDFEDYPSEFGRPPVEPGRNAGREVWSRPSPIARPSWRG